MTTEEATAATKEATAYTLEGTLLEACNCNVLCPCWIGEDPDNGTCDALIVHHIDRGQIRGIDVSGLTWFRVAHLPGNIFDGNIRVVAYVEESATPEQVEALRDAFTGRLGGPLAEFAHLIGEVVGPFQVPIEYALEEGAGSIRVGDKVRGAVRPYQSRYGVTTTLRDSAFSTIPGSPAWVGKSELLEVSIPEHGVEWRVEGTNAIQGQFRLQH